MTEVGLGEVVVGIAFTHDVIAKGIAKGYPVVLSFPKEGTGYEVGAMALIRGGSEPELAKIFYDWMLSTEAQSFIQEVVPGTPQPRGGAGGGPDHRRHGQPGGVRRPLGGA